MRLLLSILLILTCATASAQETERSIQSAEINEHHEIHLLPISIWCNKGFFFGHALKYRYNFSRRSSLTVETNGTLIRSFDRRAKHPSDQKVLPLLNESTLIFRKLLFGKGIMKTRNKAIRWMGSIRLGYQFFQHSTVYNEDYWVLDSTVANGATHLAAFQSHSLLAGIEMKREKHLRIDGRRTLIADHFFAIDYLGAVGYQLYSYDLNDAAKLNYHSIDNEFELNKSGARLNYRFTRWLKPTLGINFGLSGIWLPYIDYSSNDSFFVARGGEAIIPSYLNVNLGVTFKFNQRSKF